MNVRNIFYSLNPRQRLLLRRIWFFVPDLIRKKQHLVPPRGLVFTGAGDFIEIGNRFAKKIIDECSLNEKSHVLDIGCGIGRVARPMTTFLSNGSYRGFDIVPEGVRWCRRNYKEYTNFGFDYLPLRNDLYNLSTSAAPSQFVFPYKTETFDAAFAISVFTHMQENDVRQYVHEIARVLTRGGSCLATFFIITDERRGKNNRNVSAFFPYDCGSFYLHDSHVKDANIAFTIGTVEQMAKDAGLQIVKFLPGWWADEDKDGKFDFQDVVVLRKRV